MSTVLVTGGTGYIASHIVSVLLEKGYAVRATCRKKDSSRNKHLLDLPNATESLQLYEADLLTEGSFDEAAQGCKFVLHTASPVIFSTKDPQKDLLDPAIKGTRNVLRSCHKARVERVVLTASVAGVLGMCHEKGVGHMYTEEDWTDEKAREYAPYNYSKLMAERAAWEFHESLPESERFSLVAVNPGVVLGPSLNTSLPESVNLITPILQGLPTPDFRYSFVDVRDVSKIHVSLLENKDASGRYIVHSKDDVSFWEVSAIIRAQTKVSTSKIRLPKIFQYFVPLIDDRCTFAMIHHTHGCPYKVSNKKLQDLLNWEFIPFERTVKDTVEWMVENKHIKAK